MQILNQSLTCPKFTFMRTPFVKLVLCVFLLSGLIASAQEYQGIYFEMTDGTVSTYDLWSIEKITFSQTETLLHFSDHSIETLAISEIGHYGYTIATQINAPVSEGFRINVFPNPATDWVNVSYTLPDATNLRIDIFDLQGRHIEQLFAGFQTAGEYQMMWGASGILQSAGMYLCRLTTPSFTVNKSIIIQH